MSRSSQKSHVITRCTAKLRQVRLMTLGEEQKRECSDNMSRCCAVEHAQSNVFCPRAVKEQNSERVWRRLEWGLQSLPGGCAMINLNMIEMQVFWVCGLLAEVWRVSTLPKEPPSDPMGPDSIWRARGGLSHLHETSTQGRLDMCNASKQSSLATSLRFSTHPID